MTSTSTRAGRATTRAASGAAANAGSQALRAAGRQLLAAAGNQVLKVAVDRAVGKVDDVAGRLDAVASGERRKPSRPPTNRKSVERPAEQRESAPAVPVKVKLGAAFNLVVLQVQHLLQLIRRLAQQLLTAITQLFRRGGDDDAAAADADVTETQGVDRIVPRKKAEKSERPDGRRVAERPRAAAGQPARTERPSPAAGGPARTERPRPAAGQPARTPPAQRRQGPRPAARDAAGAPRRIAGDRPVRAARND